MTIEITQPEAEELIRARIRTGAFANVEEVILDALRMSEPTASNFKGKKFDNLSDLLLNSPFAASELDLERAQDYPRRVDLE